jgi:starch-binding outer membrane protein, SusD/RagB family
MKLKVYIAAALLALSACDIQVDPFNGVTKDNLPSVPNALKYATDGAYSLMKDQLLYKGVPDYRSTYARNLHMMLEYSSDNVTLSGTTEDPLFLSATRQHYPAMENATYVWYVAYKIINSVNQNIESVTEGADAANDNLLGENYFLRAMAYMDLLRLFAKPYTHGTGNMGVVLRLKSTDPAKMPRATVGESYNQVVADLEKAAALMEKGERRGVEYASKEAAWALLSRIYLYMDQYDKAIEYANKTIASPLVSLTPKENYLDMFWNTPKYAESIFIIKHTLQDDLGDGSIGSMYLTDVKGWGEVYQSEPLRDLLEQHADDVRNSLVKPQYGEDGEIEERNGIPKYFITKFSYQDGIVTLSSPHVVRLAEVYLNRAEAYAKKGQGQLALNDANVIRKRAGIADVDLYTLSDFQGAEDALSAVLQERHMELAYEGHRSIDVFRNKLPMDRTFPGVQPHEIVNWDAARNIYYIPQDERLANPLVEQND